MLLLEIILTIVVLIGWSLGAIYLLSLADRRLVRFLFAGANSLLLFAAVLQVVGYLFGRWPDLGVRMAGMACIIVVVNGWLLLLLAGGRCWQKASNRAERDKKGPPG